MSAPGLEGAVALAQAALGEELETGDLAEIELLHADPVDWRDGSLGCPQKGMAYTQAITPGWRLTFQARGGTWQVHTGDRRAVVRRTGSV